MKLSEKKVNRICAQAVNVKTWRENAEKAYAERLETKAGQKDVKNGLAIVHLTIPSDDHKLAGGWGINTSVTNNPYCIARRNWALKNGKLDCVCLACYADNLMNCYKTAEKTALYNQHILSSHLLTDEEISLIDFEKDDSRRYVRDEMFGDSGNLIQARNYVRIAKYWSKLKFGAWSKNWNLWRIAFILEGGKPDNMTFVLSSVFVDKVDTIPASVAQYVDYVFTVCSTRETYNRFLEEYKDNCKECAGIRCFSVCGAHCYNRGNAKYVFEILR